MKKIVIAGAGAYFFAPAIFEDLFVRFRMEAEYWMVDADLDMAELSARGFAVRAGYHCAPDAHKTIGSFDAGGGVRVSVGASNTVRDAQRLVYAVSRIAAG